MNMRRILPAALLAATLGSGVEAAPIGQGNLLVYRVGTGSALTSAAQAVFLDEYTSSGSFVQSIAMPTAVSGSNKMLTASGTATSEGELTISPNGQFIALTGYNAAAGTASVAGTASATVSRTVGIVNRSGAVDTSTSLNAFSANNIRSAVTSDGNQIWLSGANSGVLTTTVGSTGTSFTAVATTVANTRQLEIFGGQLRVSTSSGSAVRVGAVGSGLPTTSGQSIVNLPGFPTTGSPYAFYMADLSTGVAGLDTLYVADDGAGVTKYSFNGTNWSSKGTVGAAADSYRGLTGAVTGNGVQLFATRKGGSAAAGGGELVSFLDASGYDGTLVAPINLLAAAGANTAFRGVVLVPVPEPGTWGMILGGLGLLGLFAHRRRA